MHPVASSLTSITTIFQESALEVDPDVFIRSYHHLSVLLVSAGIIKNRWSSVAYTAWPHHQLAYQSQGTPPKLPTVSAHLGSAVCNYAVSARWSVALNSKRSKAALGMTKSSSFTNARTFAKAFRIDNRYQTFLQISESVHNEMLALRLKRRGYQA
jgi:hypothetical protein